MQFQTTTFSEQKQTVENKTFQILVVEQKMTAVCDKCGFSLTGTKEEIENSEFVLLEDLTLCGGCSY